VAAEKNGFGRSAHKNSRKLTRYMFYMIAVELLRDVLIRAELPVGFSDLSAAVIRTNNNQEAWDYLIGSSLGAVDEYLTQGEEESIFNEPFFNKKFNSDLNSYLKWEGVGDPEQSPRYASMMGLNKRIMGRGNPCPRDIITSAVKHNQ
jgi:hypothetical protein